MTGPGTGSGADVAQLAATCDGGPYAYQPMPFHSALSPSLPCTSASPLVSRLSCPETGRCSRCQPLGAE